MTLYSLHSRHTHTKPGGALRSAAKATCAGRGWGEVRPSTSFGPVPLGPSAAISGIEASYARSVRIADGPAARDGQHRRGWTKDQRGRTRGVRGCV